MATPTGNTKLLFHLHRLAYKDTNRYCTRGHIRLMPTLGAHGRYNLPQLLPLSVCTITDTNVDCRLNLAGGFEAVWDTVRPEKQPSIILMRIQTCEKGTKVGEIQIGKDESGGGVWSSSCTRVLRGGRRGRITGQSDYNKDVLQSRVSPPWK